ncbi:MAG: hypothetical protein AB7O44_23710, partial [Hyphomicrobiaceae bacterium]
MENELAHWLSRVAQAVHAEDAADPSLVVPRNIRHFVWMLEINCLMKETGKTLHDVCGDLAVALL